MLKSARSLLLLISLLSAPLLHAQEMTIESVQSEIDIFTAGPDFEYAPATVARAQAFLGAAILASEQNDAEEVNAALAKATSTLQEAHANADRFRSQHQPLLKLRDSARLCVSFVQVDNPLAENNPKQLLRKAEFDIASAIKASEVGQLNNSGQSAMGAEQGYRRAIELSMPSLIEQTENIISQAAGANAKRYAPVTYERAKEELAQLQRYADGITTTMPENPAYAMTVAQNALEIANHVKEWRKSYGSHEELLLKSRTERLAVAESLGMEIDKRDARSDISIEQITARLDSLLSELAETKAAASRQREQMQADFDAELAAALEQQREELLHEREAQLGGLKEAFRAKLEQETFESKRQKQIQALFKKGEVEILANLDGSILMRLTSLKFASGSSKVDAANYDLLGRVKKALEIYGERKIRIEGHTDNQGDVKLNQTVSLKRAEAVRDFLIAANVDGSRLKALGYGEVRPIASNDFEKGRAMNRRIDLVIEAK